MSNETSRLKARYCQAVMGTAAISNDENARRLIDGLTTEVPTAGVDETVKNAETDALDAIRTLADRLVGRSISAAYTEWQKAEKAVERWVAAAS